MKEFLVRLQNVKEGYRTVTVRAGDSYSARIKAESLYPGWTAFSAQQISR